LLITRDSHRAEQIQALKAELTNLRNSKATEQLAAAAALHDEAVQEVWLLAHYGRRRSLVARHAHDTAKD